MELKDILITTFYAIGGIGSVGGFTAWISKLVTDNCLDKRMEKFKSELQRSNLIELERLKADIQLRNLEHQIRFSKLHEKQAQVLDASAKLLHKLQNAVGSQILPGMFKPDRDPEQELREIGTILAEVSDQVFANQVYIPTPVFDLLLKFFAEIGQVSFEHAISKEQEIERWKKAVSVMQTNIVPLYRSINADFQKLLGMSAEQLGAPPTP